MLTAPTALAVVSATIVFVLSCLERRNIEGAGLSACGLDEVNPVASSIAG
jgi:hypothetical protein